MHQDYITVNGKIQKRERGTPAGTAVTPTFANLYLFCKIRPVMDKFVRQIIGNRRYLDDGLVVIRAREGANLLAKNLNKVSHLTLTWPTSCYEAVYPDLRIFKGETRGTDGLLDASVYTKLISKF